MSNNTSSISREYREQDTECWLRVSRKSSQSMPLLRVLKDGRRIWECIAGWEIMMGKTRKHEKAHVKTY